MPQHDAPPPKRAGRTLVEMRDLQSGDGCMSHPISFNGLIKRNLQIAEILDKIEQIVDSTPFSAEEITLILDCLRVKYGQWPQ
jgi:hypothetical protein